MKEKTYTYQQLLALAIAYDVKTPANQTLTVTDFLAFIKKESETSSTPRVPDLPFDLPNDDRMDKPLFLRLWKQYKALQKK